MVAIKIILWAISTLGLAILLQFYFLPYLKNKWTFWMLSRQIKRMSKKHGGETGEKLREISKALMDLSKNEKLFDEEDE